MEQQWRNLNEDIDTRKREISKLGLSLQHQLVFRATAWFIRIPPENAIFFELYQAFAGISRNFLAMLPHNPG